jgi:hypothetical protein
LLAFHLGTYGFNCQTNRFVGLYYGLAITLPSLAMYTDLACGCQTEGEICYVMPLALPPCNSNCELASFFMSAQECAGEGFQCYLSRSGIYALLVILMSLCNLTYHLSSTLSGSPNNKKKRQMLDISCYFFPALLCSVSYILDSLTKNDQKAENGSNLQ